MLTRTKYLQRIAHEYMEKHQIDYIDPDAMWHWAFETKKWEPKQDAFKRQFKHELGEALRLARHVDPQGRNVRSMHAVVKDQNGKQMSLWKDMRTGDREFMSVSIKQRRRHIVGECSQLKIDVDSFNENNNKGENIQLVLDFTNDVLEAELAKSIPDSDSRALLRLHRRSPFALPGSVSEPAPAHH